MATLHLEREKLYLPSDEVLVLIGGEMVVDDGLKVDMGFPPDYAWWEVPLPPCPDCGGKLVWAEAGNVPGTRKCTGCQSLFSVKVSQ